ncbi:Uncharacterised protein [Citrobacter koseri]|uniref:Uncharacterized protein n=1 Tax=Citrobacter koseri TaxID=545 RepID=A0A447UK86_CITKO|nr:Uncharacterised protein [Citrobacter koseri]
MKIRQLFYGLLFSGMVAHPALSACIKVTSASPFLRRRKTQAMWAPVGAAWGMAM